MQQSFGIATIASLTSASSRHFGGKAANLGELNSTGERVPLGIALSKDSLAYFLKANAVDLAALERIHTLGMTFIESALRAASELQRQIIDVIHAGEIPTELVAALLSELAPWLDKPLAVRSSCIVEDSHSASFAGQYLTVLNVVGQNAILTAIRNCWASQYDGRALSYAISHRAMPVLSPSMAVVLQEMIQAEHAGVCFSSGPTPKTKDVTVVEAVSGCGEQLVSGQKTPSHYEINAKLEISAARIPSANDTPPKTDIIRAVAGMAKRIAEHFGSPQDIEWASVGDTVYLLQARPITVTGSPRKTSIMSLSETPRAKENRRQQTGDSPLTVLRDDLHEWVLSTCDPFVFRGASFILASRSPSGAWRVEGHEEWDEVATALVVNLLVTGGTPPNLEWNSPATSEPQMVLGIPGALRFLASKVREDGTWGSDLWDTCQVLRALHACGIPASEPQLQRPVCFIKEEISQGLARSKQQEWFGAGLLAAALRMFSEFGISEFSEACLSMLVNSQRADGVFYGPSAHVGDVGVPSEWHTAQAISALAASGSASVGVKNAITTACDWLVSQQQRDGSWGVTYHPYCRYNAFFTSYAVLALHDADRNPDSVERAIRWFRGQQKVAGNFGDVGSSLMAMSAIQAIRGPAFVLRLPIPVFARIQSALSSVTPV